MTLEILSLLWQISRFNKHFQLFRMYIFALLKLERKTIYSQIHDVQISRRITNPSPHSPLTQRSREQGHFSQPDVTSEATVGGELQKHESERGCDKETWGL